jgi:hypothetical protein
MGDYSGLKHHAKVHSFASDGDWCVDSDRRHLYYRPDWLKWGLCRATHGIAPWRPLHPWEIASKMFWGAGGIITQITAVILPLRLFCRAWHWRGAVWCRR